MKRLYKSLLILAFLPALCLNAQLTMQNSTKKITPVVAADKARASGGIINNNAKIIVGNGAGITVTGNYISNTSGLATLSGTGFIKLTGDFVNNNTSGNPLYATSTGPVIFNGTAAQTIGGTADTKFYGMTISNSAGVLMTKNVTNEKNLVFTAGKLNVGSSILLLRASSVITGADATKFIIATGTGSVEKGVDVAGSFTLPLGDNTDTEDYSPLTFNFASGSFTSGFSKVKASVINSKNSNVTELTNYLNRYWKVSQDAIPTFSCTLTGAYTTADVTGTENHIWGAFHNGTAFTNGIKADGTNNLVSATITSFGTGGIFTGKQGNSLPTITSTAVTTGTQGIAYSYTLTATDADGDGLSYSTVGIVPSWLSFDWQTRTLSGTPANANVGNNAVTLRVSDAYGDTDQTFNINVTNVNDAPTISNVLDQTVNEDAVKEINFTVADIDNPVANLTVTASSSNTELVPLANIVFGGTDADRTATITPVANKNGQSTITLTVSDGVKRSTIVLSNVISSKTVKSQKYLKAPPVSTNTDSFVLTVTPVNDAPVCTIDPAISGTLAIGSTITGTSGSWNDILDNTDAVTPTYQWQKADDNTFATNLENITDATTNSYVLTAADKNKFLRLKVTGTDTGTPTPALSTVAYSNTLNFLNNVPVITETNPAITTNEDTAKEITLHATDQNSAETLIWSVKTGASHGTAAIKPDKKRSVGTISQKTFTYTPTANYNGDDSFIVSVSDGTTSADVTVSVTVTPVNDAPVCTVVPAITGTLAIGSTITGTSGTWNDILDNTDAVTPTYQWQKADDNAFSTNLENIADATTNTYVLSAVDQNKYLRLKVTGTDTGTPTPALNAIVYSNTMNVVIPTYVLTLTANPINGGTLEGAGSYLQGQSVTIKATPSYNYTFVNWTIPVYGVLSTEAEYINIMPASDFTITANFTVGSDIKDLLPKETAISQNYPNPFNPETAINFALAKDEKVNITIYNMKGEVVKSLVNSNLKAGYHSVNFNATGLNSGVYIYKMTTSDNGFTKKMIMCK